jgi:hypothetical protein
MNLTEKPDDELPPPEVIERRLQELSDLYELGKALREMRFVDPPQKPATDRVRERPDEPA